jgi:hypothetical protein
MIIETCTGETQTWALRALPEDYDAQPTLSEIQFDREPRVLSPDRVALASYLVFGDDVSGRLTTPQWLPPALAEAIAHDARPVWVHAVPVEFYARALPLGVRSARLVVEGIAGFESPAPPGGVALSVMRSDLSRGARASFDSLEVSSNAWMFTLGASPRRRLRIAVACAVLYAEDLELDRCTIPRGVVRPRDLAEVRRLTDTVRFDVAED